MTKEQIAELRRIANEQRADYFERENALGALPQLLDEREVLLEAARTVLAADVYQPLPRESHAVLRAAIAKAEAE